MTSGQEAQSFSEQLVSYLRYPFASCLPSSSQSTLPQERQGLLSQSEYDDSDAISLLSNIADRSRRRSRASRRREEWNRRAAVIGCGLFGRPKGQILRREVTTGDRLRSQHARNESEDSTGSQGAESEEEGGAAQSLAGSFGAGQESGDEDAGMLGDEDIAEISHSREEEEDAAQETPQKPVLQIVEADEDAATAQEQKRQEEEAAERAAIKAKLDKEAEDTAKAQAAEAAQQAAEEAALAAQEEAAAAKAKRKAERRALKESLETMRSEGRRNRLRTEAEAEAAAGGFDFAEEPEVPEYHLNEQGAEYDYSPSQYGLASGPEGYGYHDEYRQDEYLSPQLPQQPEIVHHHHYYHEPEPNPEEDQYDDSLLSPNFHIQELPKFEIPGQDSQNTAVEEDEEDADIAGIGFSKNKKGQRRGERGSNSYSAGQSNGSGSGSRRSGSAGGRGQERYDVHRKGSTQSAEGTNSGDGGSNGKRSYRDRPRRHERTGSRSTGSGTGARLREGVSARIVASSPTIEENDQRADAAAGGFEGFNSQSHPFAERSERADYRARERHSFVDNTSASSSGPRRERRREGPASAGGLNAPRNPRGANVFVQDQDSADF